MQIYKEISSLMIKETILSTLHEILPSPKPCWNSYCSDLLETCKDLSRSLQGLFLCVGGSFPKQRDSNIDPNIL